MCEQKHDCRRRRTQQCGPWPIVVCTVDARTYVIVMNTWRLWRLRWAVLRIRRYRDVVNKRFILAVGGLCAQRRIISVSYTHLDVYKRQLLIRPCLFPSVLLYGTEWIIRGLSGLFRSTGVLFTSHNPYANIFNSSRLSIISILVQRVTRLKNFVWAFCILFESFLRKTCHCHQFNNFKKVSTLSPKSFFYCIVVSS